MSIVKVGNTAAEIGGTVSTGTKVRDTNFASEEARFETGGGVGTTTIWNCGGVSDLWVHFRLTWDRVGDDMDGHLLDFMDAAGNVLFRMDMLDGLYSAAVGPDSTGASPANGVSVGMVSDTPITFDFHVWHDGAKARFDIYSDGLLVSEASYDAGTAPLIENVYFANVDQREGFGTYPIYLSELIIADGEQTLGLRLATLDPNAAGHHADLSGNISALSQPNDGQVISGDADGEKGTWTLTPYNGPATPSSIRAVVTATRSARGMTGPQNIQHLLRIGAADYNSVNLTPRPEGEVHVWDDNPATSAPWGTADLTGMEQGVEVKT